MATTAALTENSRQGINLQILPCIGQEAWLSRNPRWGCGHAYDETPVGLVVYVRNDPVNYIDPDGRQARAVSFMGYDESTERAYWHWTYIDESNGSVDPVDGAPLSGGSRGPAIIIDKPGSGVNTKITAEFRLWLIGITKEALPNRINVPECYNWLQKTIDTLRGANLLINAVSNPSDLINVVLNNSQIHVYGANKSKRLVEGRNASFAAAIGSGIYLGEKFYQPSTYQNIDKRGDQVATIIHELFQVAGASSDGGNLDDFALTQWVGESTVRTGLGGGWDNAVLNHCGLK